MLGELGFGARRLRVTYRWCRVRTTQCERAIRNRLRREPRRGWQLETSHNGQVNARQHVVLLEGRFLVRLQKEKP